MAYHLGMEKALAIKNLRQSGLSQQAIAEALGISRGAVIRHLAGISSNSTEAPTGKAPTGSEPSNGTEANRVRQSRNCRSSNFDNTAIFTKSL